jgi:hypothetical protein
VAFSYDKLLLKFLHVDGLGRWDGRDYQKYLLLSAVVAVGVSSYVVGNKKGLCWKQTH